MNFEKWGFKENEPQKDTIKSPAENLLNDLQELTDKFYQDDQKIDRTEYRKLANILRAIKRVENEIKWKIEKIKDYSRENLDALIIDIGNKLSNPYLLPDEDLFLDEESEQISYNIESWDNLWTVLFKKTNLFSKRSAVKLLTWNWPLSKFGINAWDQINIQKDSLSIVRKWKTIFSFWDEIESTIKSKPKKEPIRPIIEPTPEPKKEVRKITKKIPIEEQKDTFKKKQGISKVILDHTQAIWVPEPEEKIIQKPKIKYQPEPKVESKPEPETRQEKLDCSKMWVREFMSLSKKERFEAVATKTDNWYYKIDFKNKTLARRITLGSIIPDNYENCAVISGKLITKTVEWNYYDVWKRDINTWEFKSKFKWSEYPTWKNSRISIWNWFLVKPLNLEEKTPDKMINDPKWAKAYNNERLMRNLYWEFITKNVNNYKLAAEKIWIKNSVFSEEYFYAILNQESRFNPNAISSTKTRWFAMVTGQTIADILVNNNPKFKDKCNWISELEWFFLGEDDFMSVWREFEMLYKDGKPKYINGKPKYIWWIDAKLFVPETSIKLSLNHFLYIEKRFNFLPADTPKQIEFKRQIISMAYNMWPWFLVKFLEKEYNKWNKIGHVDKVTQELWAWVKRKEIKPKKYNEVVWYAKKVKKHLSAIV